AMGSLCEMEVRALTHSRPQPAFRPCPCEACLQASLHETRFGSSVRTRHGVPRRRERAQDSASNGEGCVRKAPTRHLAGYLERGRGGPALHGVEPRRAVKEHHHTERHCGGLFFSWGSSHPAVCRGLCSPGREGGGPEPWRIRGYWRLVRRRPSESARSTYPFVHVQLTRTVPRAR